jgi:hypothetical protein
MRVAIEGAKVGFLQNFAPLASQSGVSCPASRVWCFPDNLGPETINPRLYFRGMPCPYRPETSALSTHNSALRYAGFTPVISA